MGDEQSTYGKNPVFGKGKAESTKDQKTEDADICEVQNNRTRTKHAVTRKIPLLGPVHLP